MQVILLSIIVKPDVSEFLPPHRASVLYHDIAGRVVQVRGREVECVDQQDL